MINSLLFIFCGIMTGQFLYMCALWLQHKRREYAFYVIHYLILVYFLLSVSYAYIIPEDFVADHKSLFKWLGFHPLHIFNFYLYIKFSQHFLEAPKQYPYLNQQAGNLMKGTWVAFVITLFAWYFYETNSQLFFGIYMAIYISLKLWAIWVLYIVYRQHTRETGYILRATIFLSGGLVCIYTLLAFVDAGIINRTGWIFLPCIIGILGEIYHVNAGLNYKASLKRRGLIDSQQRLIQELQRNRQLLQENENVRNDLSLQLNKEVGITLDGISLFAEHTLQQFSADSSTDIEPVLQRIVHDSNRMVSSMNDIVWSLSPDNDRAIKAVQRIYTQFLRICKEKNIEFEFINHFTDSQLTMGMKERKELYDGWRTIMLAVLNAIDHRLIVQVSGCESELRVTMEGLKQKGPAKRVLILPDPGGLFSIMQNTDEDDHIYRTGFSFKTG
jgi:signal transduction histidine kinase